MDTLAHGLWGGAVFGQKEKAHFKWAFLLGMGPDLCSFGPFFLTHLPYIFHRWTSQGRMTPPDPQAIPAYVYQAYNVSHSLVVWAAVALALYFFRRSALWPFSAWALHILCDIPTHSVRFFPTPYLWPLDTPFVDGRPWARSPFMLLNYGLIAATYLTIRIYKTKRSSHVS